ncbi:peroxiredoxin [Flavobacterium sp. NG2]|uniref:peroxiredoxin n=1 Tax=Flavobacterium sp. NG2 TaxID=3097547 RepID=UPI002A820AF0|nr:peroxiredoxin [Flavobacterium sp. NG2]WPR71576.1 peroxiredoxin [Flavobacterium sp. NG2]
MGLKVGDKIPLFRAQDSLGNVFDSQTLIGQKPVVIYFYPKDDTPGCTTQACSFRDQYQDFKELGAEVIGISSDGLESHQEFSKKYKLPFILLSDENQKIRSLFGVPSRFWGLLPGRVTYVVDKNGVVQMVFNGIFAAKHIPKALEVVKQLVI